MKTEDIFTQLGKKKAKYIIKRIHEIENESKKYVCPVYFKSNSVGEKLIHIASSVLVKIEDMYFAITASHVLDNMEHGNLLLAGTTLFVPANRPLQTSLRTGEKRADDFVDIGFVLLKESEVNLLEYYSFMPITEIIPFDMPKFGRPYSFIGYPSNRNKLKNGIRPAPYSYMCTPLPIDDYKLYNELSQDLHIAIVYDSRKTHDSLGKPTQFPDPTGMSGGGLWAWDISNVLDCQGPVVFPKLGGITIARTPDKKVWYAIKAGFVLEAIRKAFPQLDQSIPKCDKINVNVHII